MLLVINLEEQLLALGLKARRDLCPDGLEPWQHCGEILNAVEPIIVMGVDDRDEAARQRPPDDRLYPREEGRIVRLSERDPSRPASP